MSVLEKNSIDYIYAEDNHIIMGISDHLTWQEECCSPRKIRKTQKCGITRN